MAKKLSEMTLSELQAELNKLQKEKERIKKETKGAGSIGSNTINRMSALNHWINKRKDVESVMETPEEEKKLINKASPKEPQPELKEDDTKKKKKYKPKTGWAPSKLKEALGKVNPIYEAVRRGKRKKAQKDWWK